MVDKHAIAEGTAGTARPAIRKIGIGDLVHAMALGFADFLRRAADQHLFLSRRLLARPRVSQVDADPGVYGAESRPDCRRFHAHALGTFGAAICHYPATGVGADICRHHDVRIGLYDWDAAHLLRHFLRVLVFDVGR